MTSNSLMQVRISQARRRVAAKLVDVGLAALVGVGLWLVSLDDWVILGPLASFFLYQTLAHWLFGATVGKRLLGLRMYRANGERPGLYRCILRSLFEFAAPVLATVANFVVLIGLVKFSPSPALVVLALGGIFVAGYWSWLIAFVTDLTVMLSRRDSRSLHDLVAGTSVSLVRGPEDEVPAASLLVATDLETAPAWRRLAARTLDFVGCAAILIAFGAVSPDEVQLIAWVMVAVAYPVVTQWVYGQTLGKVILGIAVVHHAGGPISIWRSLWRWLVEIVPLGLVGIGAFLLSLNWLVDYWSDDSTDGLGGLFLAILALVYAFVLGAFALVLASALDSLVAFSNARRRTFHDFLAGTRVVSRKKETERPRNGEAQTPVATHGW
ncbi:MAG: RDD family protein [Dehalococcoidia bacterium]